MLSLQINNPNIEKIFLEGFNSNKDKFFEFIQNSYDNMKLNEDNHNDKEILNNFKTSLKELKLVKEGKLKPKRADEFLSEL